MKRSVLRECARSLRQSGKDGIDCKKTSLNPIHRNCYLDRITYKQHFFSQLKAQIDQMFPRTNQTHRVCYFTESFFCAVLL
jgi:hypothetical protein